MFFTFFKRELVTGLKQPMVYIFAGIIALLVFFAVVSDNVIIGGAVGDVHKNSPSVVGNFTSILTIFGLLFATAFFNNAALRDHKYNFSQILFSTPLNKAGYFFGRFFGAWVLSALVMTGIGIGVTLGSILGPAANWIAPERIGAIPWGAYWSSYCLFVLPNMFFAGAIIFLLATQFKSTVVSFIGSLFIIIGYILSLNLMSDLDNEAIGALLDMFGISAYNLEIRYLTPAELNVTNPSFSGNLLKNRLLWTGIGSIILLVAYFLFSFATKMSKPKKAKKEVAEVFSSEIGQFTGLDLNAKSPSVWSTFTSFFQVNFLAMVKSSTFIILLLFALIILISNLWNGFEYFGLQSYPVTYKMLDEVENLSLLFVMIVLVFFSGELIWRERDFRLNEVIDSTPHPFALPLLAKAAALVVLASCLHLFMFLVAIIYQALNGYTNFELNLYLFSFLGNSLPTYLIWGILFLFLQVVINNKYIAYFAAILALFILDLVLSVLKIESNMLSIGGTPLTQYSDMNSFGPGVLGHFWFTLYWVLFGIITLLISILFIPKGMNKKIKDRFSSARKSLNTSYYSVLGIFALAFLGTAGVVYYNTQILNPYKTSYQIETQQVNYEKQYRRYADMPHVSILDATYHIDIYPEQQAANGRVELLATNKNEVAVDSLLFTVDKTYQQALSIPNSKLVFEDKELGFLIYKLDIPLAPRDSIKFTTTFDYTPKGFKNSVDNFSMIENGTFFNNLQIMPQFGYSKSYELGDKNKRRKYQLAERKSMPDLEETCSQLCLDNYLSEGAADWVDVQTYISTTEDQIAIAPGSLLNQTTQNGRTSSHYKVDHPSQNFYSFSSARYAVAKRRWKEVDIEVYYHPAHSVNVNRMLDAVEQSLVYYTREFGPYYHKQARIIEFPRYSTFAQAFPGTMPYSEAFGFIINLEDENKNNVIDAVIAHEMAHQYWAHQVIGANMKGSTMLSESFAEYSSLMVMKQKSTAQEMKDFLKYDMQRYLSGRRSETEQEQPLVSVENQSHIHYGKGSVILYALQEYIGEAKVNNALRNFLEAYRYKEPPYPNARDFMRYLQPEVPDSLQYLLLDWFEEITLYDLRVASANAKALQDGQYEISMNIVAKKLKFDGEGNSTERLIADWIDVGFYADRDEKEIIARERIYINRENTILKFTLNQLPVKAAIDPLNLLIDRVEDDNVKTVTLEE